MTRTVCVLILVCLAGTALAETDPTVSLYTDVLEQVRAEPGDPTILLTMLPPTEDKNAKEQKALIDDIVDVLASAAKNAPENYEIAYNYYQILRFRYQYYGAAEDASAAKEQFETAIFLLYTNVRDHVTVEPGDRTALLTLLPPEGAKADEEKALLDEIVDILAAAAEGAPEDFSIGYNYYQALWLRYMYNGSADDAASAMLQLKATKELARVGSTDRALAQYEYAKNILSIIDTDVVRSPGRNLAKELFGDEPLDVAIEAFNAAKRASLNRGSTAAYAAMTLGELYRREGELDAAQQNLREALDLDAEHRGFVTNHAYDLLGLVLLERGNEEGAIVMLDHAMMVRNDVGLQTDGYAYRLAKALVEQGCLTEAIEYLQSIADLAAKGQTTLDLNILHTIATAYTEQGNSDLGLLYWNKYLVLEDPNVERRKTAEAMAFKLTTEIQGK